MLLSRKIGSPDLYRLGIRVSGRPRKGQRNLSLLLLEHAISVMTIDRHYLVDAHCDTSAAVLHVIHSLEGGGTERTLVSLLRATSLGGVRHAVVTLRAPGSLCSRLPDHVACIPLGAAGSSRFLGFSLARTVRRTRAKLIHARNAGCWADALMAGCLTPGLKVILAFHGLESEAGFSAKQRFLIKAARYLGSRFSTNSFCGRQQLLEQGGVPIDRVDVILGGVDLLLYKPATDEMRRSIRRELNLNDDAFVVGSVGSLTTVKRHCDLIESMRQLAKRLPKLRLLIVGDGPLRSDLQRQARVAGLDRKIHFVGRREDVGTLLGAMDVYVCPSASESMSNAVLEAMASGLPVVTTDVGDHALTVRDGVEGRVVEKLNPAHISDAIVNLMLDPQGRSRMTVASRLRVESLSFERMTERYRVYYDNILTHREGPEEEKSDCARLPNPIGWPA